MRLIRKPSWSLSESLVTPEATFLNRRALLGAMAGGAAAAMLPARHAHAAKPGDAFEPTPTRNPAFKIGEGRAMTEEDYASTYNNFYEFGSHKKIWKAAQALDTDDWRIQIDGEVEKPMEIGAEELTAKMPLEERIYRHRCVEAWSMVVPWIGYPLAELVKMAKPLSSAKYVRFETFMNPKVASGQRQVWYPWPYTEGLTIEEATNPLPLMVVGVYGKVLPKQFGAPVRLHVPWKYGFKSIKSITRISFTEKRPVSYWEDLQDKEYGFWANVNPEVDHPRWTQATEKVLGTEKRIPTLPWNGYGEEVAGLYAGMEAKIGDRLYR